MESDNKVLMQHYKELTMETKDILSMLEDISRKEVVLRKKYRFFKSQYRLYKSLHSEEKKAEKERLRKAREEDDESSSSDLFTQATRVPKLEIEPNDYQSYKNTEEYREAVKYAFDVDLPGASSWCTNLETQLESIKLIDHAFSRSRREPTKFRVEAVDLKPGCLIKFSLFDNTLEDLYMYTPVITNLAKQIERESNVEPLFAVTNKKEEVDKNNCKLSLNIYIQTRSWKFRPDMVVDDIVHTETRMYKSDCDDATSRKRAIVSMHHFLKAMTHFTQIPEDQLII